MYIYQLLDQGTAYKVPFSKSLNAGKKALGENKYVAATLMDLSKAFNCLSHDLLFLKIKFYGVSYSALDLIQSNLSNRKRCVKIENFISDFKTVYKDYLKAQF